MDEAVYRFHCTRKKDGLIACLDADSLCDKNYLRAIITHFKNNPSTPACSIYYEHPLNGNDYSAEIYNGILYYELHLRYYIQALRYAGYPNAFHTIGSSMAVRNTTYQKHGGMNKRKAGEDFYFLHKIIPTGGFTEINNTRVIPSPRPSNRVPFGTGRAIENWLKNSEQHFYTYSPKTFFDLQEFIIHTEELFSCDWNIVKQELPFTLVSFFESHGITNKIAEINKNAATLQQKIKRFYNWLDGFMVLKFIHYCKDNFYDNIHVDRASQELLIKIIPDSSIMTPSELLNIYRKLDRNSLLYIKRDKLPQSSPHSLTGSE